MVRDEQIDQVEVLTKLTNARCTNVVKNTRRVPIPGPGPWTKFLTVSDAALDKFQMAVYAAKHGKQTSRALVPLDIDPDSFDNLRAQREIEDKATSDKPVLPTGLTLENDLRISKTFENVVEHLGRYISTVPSNLSAFTVSFVLNVDIKILLLGPNVEVRNQSDRGYFAKDFRLT